MEENEEGMTKKEIQRFLALAAEEGKTELAAYQSLMFVLGIEPPAFRGGQNFEDPGDMKFVYLLREQQELLENVAELIGLGEPEKAKEAVIKRLETVQETLHC